jgi:hypothetical protein
MSIILIDTLITQEKKSIKNIGFRLDGFFFQTKKKEHDACVLIQLETLKIHCKQR